MRIAFYYYSSTGNTRLACRYIAHHLNQAQVDLIDMAQEAPDNISSSYDVVGFATPTFFMGVPYLVGRFIEQLPEQKDKPAFVFSTYGMMSGQTLKILARLVTARGFKIISGHSLLMPESYPVFIAKGWGNVDAPGEKEMAGFNRFIGHLSDRLAALQAGQPAERARISIGLLNSLMRPKPPAGARREIGPLYVDEALCAGCGTCGDACPYDAITFDSKPIFVPERCCGCWTCFNRCPQQAIFTQKIKGTGHYPGPNEQVAAKRSVSYQ